MRYNILNEDTFCSTKGFCKAEKTKSATFEKCLKFINPLFTLKRYTKLIQLSKPFHT